MAFNPILEPPYSPNEDKKDSNLTRETLNSKLQLTQDTLQYCFKLCDKLFWDFFVLVKC